MRPLISKHMTYVKDEGRVIALPPSMSMKKFPSYVIISIGGNTHNFVAIDNNSHIKSL